MTPRRFPNPLAADFLEIAEHLARTPGRRNLQQAAMRRAVSTAYYALFHALCYTYADGLVRWSRTDLVDKVYRHLDHGSTRKRLSIIAEQIGAQNLRRLSSAFSSLQDKRYDADYRAPALVFSLRDVLAALQQAREAIDVLSELDEGERRKLAVDLMVVRQR